jgi:hypothetical protein
MSKNLKIYLSIEYFTLMICFILLLIFYLTKFSEYFDFFFLMLLHSICLILSITLIIDFKNKTFIRNNIKLDLAIILASIIVAYLFFYFSSYLFFLASMITLFLTIITLLYISIKMFRVANE